MAVRVDEPRQQHRVAEVDVVVAIRARERRSRDPTQTMRPSRSTTVPSAIGGAETGTTHRAW